jgi:ADP-ribosyl-[dinitrogen reductase] hydrolase
MIGAIIGDIVGARFEFDNHKDQEFDLFGEKSTFTDDSVMTIAIAKAIMATENVYGFFKRNSPFSDDGVVLLQELSATYMRALGRAYPDRGYGNMFSLWLEREDMGPYHSYGNGAAMRISPVGMIARNEAEAILLSKAVTSITHDHVEGIKGAEATVIAMIMGREGKSKDQIKERISSDYYDLGFTIDGIRDTYEFNETCQETVPQAIMCFLESRSFEDAIRISISLGGDSDTIAAIAGGIAETRYAIPTSMRDRAMSYLDDDLKAIVRDFVTFTRAYGSIKSSNHGLRSKSR